MGDLVVSPLHESRIDADDGTEAAAGQASREGDGVLLRYADVEETVGEVIGEIRHARAAAHGGRDHHDALVFFRQVKNGLGDGVGVSQIFFLSFYEFAGRGVEFADAVVAFRILFRGSVAFAFLGAAVQHHRHDLLGGAGFQDPDKLLDVVAVHRTDVVEAHLLEDIVDDEKQLESAQEAHAEISQMDAYHGNTAQDVFAIPFELAVMDVRD